MAAEDLSYNNMLPPAPVCCSSGRPTVVVGALRIFPFASGSVKPRGPDQMGRAPRATTESTLLALRLLRLGSHRGHLFAVRTEQSRSRAARQTTHQAQLPAVVNPVA